MANALHPESEAAAQRIAGRLSAAGFRALFAGGCVRDRLMGRQAKDTDIVTNATPDQVEALFPGSEAVGKAFGVIIVREGRHAFEVATFRRDAAYDDGRRPRSVTFTDEATDARRRDFTINGMFLDPATGEVIDHVGGRADLAARLIRAIGDPSERFAEDYLRMLRAVRFASVLEFEIEPATAAAIRRLAPRAANLSAERVQSELTRMLVESPRAGRGLVLLRETGLLDIVLPEVAAMAGVEQPAEFHPEGDVFTHTVGMLDLMPRPREADLVWSVLLHDVGKPPTRAWGPGADGKPRIRFDGHDKAGSDIADRVLRRLRLPNRTIERVVGAVAGHMRFINVPQMRRATLRRMVGSSDFELNMELHRLDCLASHGNLENYDRLRAAAAEWQSEAALPKPLVRGGDVIGWGVPVGPQVGRWMAAAYEQQLEHPEWDRERLLGWLQRAIAAGGGAPDQPGRDGGLGSPNSP